MLATVVAALAATGFGAGNGVSVRAPDGWLVRRPHGITQGVTNPVLGLELASPAGTVVQIRELVPRLFHRGALTQFPPRPRRFDVRALRPTAGCVLPGSVGTSFRERGRAFYVVVQRPVPRVGRVLDTLRIGRL